MWVDQKNKIKCEQIFEDDNITRIENPMNQITGNKSIPIYHRWLEAFATFSS